ncbi:acetoin utilization AcuB family protein [Bacillus sp. DX1.1]|uniref:acetoin utilization AcuB family protein n=1 Tax=unclassified Bacillus (in: firmicutes) TaxID=185979 RepID=UPI002570BA03|nr:MULTISPECIES: acetoin utilization AcuB family protein [unclassified Bacillus (in: firmicutes)]MDM5156834.1 acetoin utilization AcuB family protein [Bacillus sp. DX1.1]WJE81080.1 acetoin utilization AcuB family protein [Bacillus sp. DX3.1]
MIVEEIMNQDVIALHPDDTIETALRTLNAKSIRHIPIVNHDNNVVGIISDRDVRDASPSILDERVSIDTLKQPIKLIMKQPVMTCHPLDFVEEIATLFFENKIGCLPVTKSGKLVGVISESTVLHTLVKLTGAYQPSSQIEIQVKNEPGILGKVVAIFSELHINIVSVLVYPAKDESAKVLVFRIQTMNPLRVIEELEQKGYRVLWPNIMGMQT